MEKSKNIELLASKIQESLNGLNQFPKMYHPTDDELSIPLLVEGEKLVVTVKKVN